MKKCMWTKLNSDSRNHGTGMVSLFPYANISEQYRNKLRIGRELIS